MDFGRGILVSAVLFLQLQSASASTFDLFFGKLPTQNAVSFGATREVKPLATNNLRVLVWNIQKGENKAMPADFQRLGQFADVTLFQEAITDPVFTTALTNAVPQMGWTVATSWEFFDGTYTGVATGSRAAPLREEVLISKVTEPVSSTPKTILLSEYALEGRPDTLLIANVHGINFVTTDTYKVQMRELVMKLREHPGPLLVAGDFNTWNGFRLDYLKSMLAPLGVDHVETPPTDSFFSLDHIFVRGLKATTAYDLNPIKTSDHTPLLVDLTFDPYVNQLSKVAPSVQR